MKMTFSLYKVNFLLLLLVAVSTWHCSPKAASKSKETTLPPLPIANEPIKEIVTEDGRYLVASIKKTPCYGSCPVFEFELYSDGTAVFNGIQHVERLGKYASTAPPSWFQELAQKAQTIGYFSFAEKYPPNGRTISDFPMTTTFLRTEKLQRTVANNFDAPVALQQFEQLFFQKIETLKWVKMQE